MLRKCEKCGKIMEFADNINNAGEMHYYCPKCFNEAFKYKADPCDRCGKLVSRQAQNCMLEVNNEMWLLCGDCQIEARRMIEDWIGK